MKRNDIHKVLIIGSGPIIIGQACEFDYSGTQACKALRKLGYEIVLVNSNPATIMTDPGDGGHYLYRAPQRGAAGLRSLKKNAQTRCCPTLAASQGLNLCSELKNAGVLDKYDVKVIGVQVDAIERGEDRIEFKKTMNELGIEMARSEVAYSVDEALAIADKLGYPVVLRPAYTMGGAGGGLVYNIEELKTVCARGLQASLVGQVLVEESILGWEELELEVVRDAKNNMITVCFIENIDPLGRAYRRFLLLRAHADHFRRRYRSVCRSRPTRLSRPSRSSAAPTCSLPTTPYPAVSSSSRSTPAPPARRLWPPRRPASPSRWCRPCWQAV